MCTLERRLNESPSIVRGQILCSWSIFTQGGVRRPVLSFGGCGPPLTVKRFGTFVCAFGSGRGSAKIQLRGEQSGCMDGASSDWPERGFLAECSKLLWPWCEATGSGEYIRRQPQGSEIFPLHGIEGIAEKTP